MILHLVSKAEWDSKPPNQAYVPNAFSKDGFIHCTQGDLLLLDVANRFYKNVPGDFLVLGIDETKVTSPVKWEAAAAMAADLKAASAPAASAPAASTANPPAAPSAPAVPSTPTPAEKAVAPKATPKASDLPPEAKAEFGTIPPEAVVPQATNSEQAPAPALPSSPAPSLPASPAPAPAASAPVLFPHIYGPLNRDAIMGIRRVLRAPDGTFTGFAPLESAPQKGTPPQTRLKRPSELANELLDATDEFSEALARYKDKIEGRMDELDKKINDL